VKLKEPLLYRRSFDACSSSNVASDSVTPSSEEIEMRSLKKQSRRFTTATGVSVLVATLGLGACNTAMTDRTESGTANKEVVVKVLEGAFNRYDVAVIRENVAETYVQHNPQATDGRAGLAGLVEYLSIQPKSERPSVQIRRVLADGKLVVAHSEYQWGPKKLAVFDVFRVNDGKLVEHWDAIQEQPAQTANGQTMLDGPTAIRERDRTAANKELVERFVDDTLVNGRMERFTGYFDGERYVRHNPLIPDSPSGLVKAFTQMAKQGIIVRYDEVKCVSGSCRSIV
jgi:predicted SnoaL-like aldol condensation-catalyzing enzyme